MQSKFYEFFLRHVVPRLRWPEGLPMMIRLNSMQWLEDGDLVLVRTKKSLGAKLIPGLWDHLLVYTNHAPKFQFVEMIAHGWNEVDYKHVFNDCDGICILRPKLPWSKKYINIFRRKCLSFKGCKYDNQFTLGIKTLYCFEMAYQSDVEHKLNFNLEDLAGLGRPYLSGNGIRNCPDLRVVYEFTNT